MNFPISVNLEGYLLNVGRSQSDEREAVTNPPPDAAPGPNAHEPIITFGENKNGWSLKKAPPAIERGTLTLRAT
jgi:hypothetical protein